MFEDLHHDRSNQDTAHRRSPCTSRSQRDITKRNGGKLTLTTRINETSLTLTRSTRSRVIERFQPSRSNPMKQPPASQRRRRSRTMCPCGLRCILLSAGNDSTRLPAGGMPADPVCARLCHPVRRNRTRYGRRKPTPSQRMAESSTTTPREGTMRRSAVVDVLLQSIADGTADDVAQTIREELKRDFRPMVIKRLDRSGGSGRLGVARTNHQVQRMFVERRPPGNQTDFDLKRHFSGVPRSLG